MALHVKIPWSIFAMVVHKKLSSLRSFAGYVHDCPVFFTKFANKNNEHNQQKDEKDEQ